MSNTQLELFPLDPNEAVKMLTLWQPYATFVPLLLKAYETREWGTPHRGTLIIHAASESTHAMNEADWQLVSQVEAITGQSFPRRKFCIYGAIVAITTLRNCLRMDESLIQQQTTLEQTVGTWSVGRVAWQLENIRSLLEEPIYCRGHQGLRSVPPEIIHLLNLSPPLFAPLPPPVGWGQSDDRYLHQAGF